MFPQRIEGREVPPRGRVRGACSRFPAERFPSLRPSRCAALFTPPAPQEEMNFSSKFKSNTLEFRLMPLPSRTLKLSLVALVLAGLGHLAGAADAGKPSTAFSDEGLDFFEKKIRPLLVERCYECHSAESKKLKGGLRLDSRDGVLKGGDSGPAVMPGEPDKSLLIKAVRFTDEELQMPPHHKLAAEQIADLEKWVKIGVPDSRPIAAGGIPQYGIDIARGREFWSFQPIKKLPPPAVQNRNWTRNPIDNFILAKLEEKGLVPSSDAPKRTLIRRATFDLIGLPPTPDEVEAFLKDKTPEAFSNVVERLLASPHYGERWGRHWLDVARYADTSGCNSDYPVPAAYKYRNYVIESFNCDKPYDQFIREQIAGDLLPAGTDEERFEHIIATGYLAISRRFGSRNNEFHLTIEDTIDNVGKGVLGLSVSCARCHDHKFDPIPTRDYYALYGIFNSTRYAFPGTEIYRHPKDFVPLTSRTNAEAVMKYQAELAALDDQIEKLQVEKRSLEKEEAREEARDATTEESQTDDRLLKVKAALEDAHTKQRMFEADPPAAEKAYAVAEAKAADAKIQKKGDPNNPGEVAPRGFLQVFGGATLPKDETGSGRLELAQWLTDPKNPLLARVMVNRLWQHHFGHGIVQTPNDFGTRGKRPTHPELLDRLASHFIQNGWSIKAMHRLVMLSHAYQISSVPAGAMEVDANNELLWRFNRRRLDAEEIRDAMLSISGSLDATMGGAHPFPPENDWHYTQHRPFVAVYESNRRSIYLMQQRIKKQPFLETFDGADSNATVGERPVSTTPLQALFMMNDPFAHEQADKFGVRIGLAFADEAGRINFAYRLAFGRPANKEEIRAGKDYLKACQEDLKETKIPAEQRPRAALASFCRVLFSSNEFIFVD
jgi:uncharacterized protein DUF1553/uncharacterized protein DUF1549/cytochrome c